MIEHTELFIPSRLKEETNNCIANSLKRVEHARFQPIHHIVEMLGGLVALTDHLPIGVLERNPSHALVGAEAREKVFGPVRQFGGLKNVHDAVFIIFVLIALFVNFHPDETYALVRKNDTPQEVGAFQRAFLARDLAIHDQRLEINPTFRQSAAQIHDDLRLDAQNQLRFGRKECRKAARAELSTCRNPATLWSVVLDAPAIDVVQDETCRRGAPLAAAMRPAQTTGQGFPVASTCNLACPHGCSMRSTQSVLDAKSVTTTRVRASGAHCSMRDAHAALNGSPNTA